MQKRNKKAKVGPNQSWVEILLYLLKKTKSKNKQKNAKMKTKRSKLCPNQSWVEI